MTDSKAKMILKNISNQDIDIILSEPYFLYYILFYEKIQPNSNLLEFLFQKISKETVLHFIYKFQIPKQPVAECDKLGTIKNFFNIIKSDCKLSNTFLQDMFQPSYIFKTKYIPYNFDIYATSFYYLMQCKYKKNQFPLSVLSHDEMFSFPFDVNPKEWIRPTFIIDVQNTLLFENTLHINGKTYDTRYFSTRRKIILKERVFILEKLFQKHNLQNALVLFISQADSSDKNAPTCLKITNLKNKSTERILVNGRIALFIEVPCSEFVYNVKNYFVNDFSILDDTTGQKNEKKLLKYWFDKYNVLYYFDEDAKKYKKANPFTYNRQIQKLKNEQQQQKQQQQKQEQQQQKQQKTHKIINGIKVKQDQQQEQKYEQKNQFKHLILNNKSCSKGIGKNEQDDYMIGLILLLIHKTSGECYKFVTQYTPIVFTNDNYSWMRDSLKKKCIFEQNFFHYLHTNRKVDISKINQKRFKFWFNNSKLNTNKIFKISNELSKNLV